MRPPPFTTGLIVLASAVVGVLPWSAAHAQRGGRAGTLPPVSAAPPGPPPSSVRGGGVMGPGYGVVPRGGPGQLPRLQTGGHGYARTYDPRYPGSRYDGRYDGRYDSRYGRRSDGRPGDYRYDNRYPRSSHYRPFKCLGACGSVALLGAPFVVGGVVYERHEVSGYSASEYVAPEAAAAGSRVIIVGGGGNTGETLSVEQLGDTALRVSWLPTNRPAREVSLFVADSAQQPLVTHRLAPAAPTAVFETTRLAAPIAFIGATVLFADSVRTTTLVPYPRGR